MFIEDVQADGRVCYSWGKTAVQIAQVKREMLRELDMLPRGKHQTPLYGKLGSHSTLSLRRVGVEGGDICSDCGNLGWYPCRLFGWK